MGLVFYLRMCSGMMFHRRVDPRHLNQLSRVRNGKDVNFKQEEDKTVVHPLGLETKHGGISGHDGHPDNFTGDSKTEDDNARNDNIGQSKKRRYWCFMHCGSALPDRKS